MSEISIAERAGDLVPWVEKYRPKTIEDCILPDRIKEDFKHFVKKDSFPNLLLSGTAGTGKTTIARALCEELSYDYILINASDERNIETVRTRIRDFASTSSILGNKKAIILDEADGLNHHAQPALRAAIEEFSNTRFILTCNYKNKLIEPLRSRTSIIEFNVKKTEATKIKISFLQRVFEILDAENVTYDKSAVGNVVKQFFPDNRRVLNELQRYAISGEIDTGILAVLENSQTAVLVDAIKSKNFKLCRQWIEDNSDLEIGIMYRAIYDAMYTEITPESVPDLCIQTADYQYKASFAADQNINTMAYVSALMRDVEFK